MFGTGYRALDDMPHNGHGCKNVKEFGADREMAVGEQDLLIDSGVIYRL
jgi:hypothetical protein